MGAGVGECLPDLCDAFEGFVVFAIGDDHAVFYGYVAEVERLEAEVPAVVVYQQVDVGGGDVFQPVF